MIAIARWKTEHEVQYETTVHEEAPAEPHVASGAGVAPREVWDRIVAPIVGLDSTRITSGTVQASRERFRSILRAERLQEKFERLAAIWRDETAFLSSISDQAMHPAYQQIIGMGPDVLPVILRQLAETPEHWFWALKAISGEDPVPRDHAGDVPKMAEAWLAWGRNRGEI